MNTETKIEAKLRALRWQGRCSRLMNLRTVQTVATVTLTASWIGLVVVICYWPELLLALIF